MAQRYSMEHNVLDNGEGWKVKRVKKGGQVLKLDGDRKEKLGSRLAILE